MKFIHILCNIQAWSILLFLDLTHLSNLIHKYIFNDIGFLPWLVIAMVLDFITGITKVWVTQGSKSVTSRGFRDSVKKVIQYGSFLIITHVLTHFEINGQIATTYDWLNKIAYEFLILVEIKSVYENIVRINPELDFIKPIIANINDYINRTSKTTVTTTTTLKDEQ